MNNTKTKIEAPRHLTPRELRWLHSRGGRTESDVEWSVNGKPYTMMGTRDGGERPVFIDDAVRNGEID